MTNSLLQNLSEGIHARVCARGEAYQRAHLVTLEDVSLDRIEASVMGAAPYAVEMVLDEATILARCACSYFDREFEICKHIWAVLVEAEDQQRLIGRWPAATSLVAAPAEVFQESRPGEDLDALLELSEDRTLDAALSSEDASEEDDLPGRNRTRLLRAILKDIRDRSTPPEAASFHADRYDTQIVYILSEDHALPDELEIEVCRRERRQNGEWGRPKPLRFPLEAGSLLPTGEDRRILSLLGVGEVVSAHLDSEEAAGSFPSGDASRLLIPDDAAEVVAPFLCDTGRFLHRVSRNRGDDLLLPLRWDGEAGSWEMHLALLPLSDGETPYALSGYLRRGDERLEFPDPGISIHGSVLIHEDRLAPADTPGAREWIPYLRRLGSIPVPESQVELVLTTLLTASPPPSVDLPETLRLETVAVPPRPRLRAGRVQGERAGSPGLIPCMVSFEYPGERVSSGDRRTAIVDLARRRVIRRDLAVERQAIERLHALGCRRAPRYRREDAPLEIQPKRLPALVRALVSEGWYVEAEGGVVRRAASFDMQVSSGVDWFELRGGASFGDETVPFPRLLAALQRGEGWVRLDGGRVGILPEEWLARYQGIAGLGTVEGEALRFRPSQIGLLDVLLEATPEVTVDLAFREARKKLRGFDGVVAEDPPAGFRGTLRDYQRDGLGWFRFLRDFGFGGCLADDMGLGKTVQVLALLLDRHCNPDAPVPRPSLVVAPSSVVFNWVEEAARFAPELRVREHIGPGRERSRAAFADCDLVVTSYGTLRRDAVFFREEEFDYVILDEAQAIKNASTQAAKAARLLHGEHRLALSGTPIENHLGELWSLFEFLNPGMLGRARVFLNATGNGTAEADTARDLLARALRPYILRRTKAQVARELPPRTEQTLHCEMGPAQRKLYNELRDHYRASLEDRLDASGIERSGIQILEALLRLRQAACHPGLIDAKRAEASSAKLDALFPHLEEVVDEGSKALVFSQFTSFLSLVRRRLDEAGTPYAYLDGRTRNRDEVVRRFQEDPDCSLFLVSLKAGGVGLNLTAAEYVYLLDPWWNPAVEAQAIDRAHRIGQSRAVFAYRLVCRDTVEEKILELQATKRDLADSILRADSRLVANLTRDDIALLLS